MHETIEFNDIAGLVRGASQGEGLGNKFLAAIRETEAICHVVRCHAATGVPHPEGRIDPLDDIELIETELLAADLEQAERRLERVAKQARSLDTEAVAERDWLESVVEGLAGGRPVRSLPAPEAAADAPRKLSALSSKPVLYVVNVDEGVDEVPAAVAEHAREREAVAVAVSRPGRVRARRARRRRRGRDATRARDRRVGARAGGPRCLRPARPDHLLHRRRRARRRWRAACRAARRRGTAAGQVHTQIQEAFVRAEVIAWEELVEAGGYAGARDRGLLRIEGRDYVVADGDVVHIKV